MQQQRLIFKDYSYQGTAYVYTGAMNERMGQGILVTSGSSTTVTSGGTVQAFSQAGVGDLIRVVVAGVTSRRRITAKASHDSVTVDTAINLPAASRVVWHHTPQPSGILDTSGWVNVQHLTNKLVYIQLTTKGSAAGISYSIEGRGPGLNSTPRELLTGTLTAAVVAGTTNTAAADVLTIAEHVMDIRVGVKNANDGADIVSCWVTGEQMA